MVDLAAHLADLAKPAQNRPRRLTEGADGVFGPNAAHVQNNAPPPVNIHARIQCVGDGERLFVEVIRLSPVREHRVRTHAEHANTNQRCRQPHDPARSTASSTTEAPSAVHPGANSPNNETHFGRESCHRGRRCELHGRRGPDNQNRVQRRMCRLSRRALVPCPRPINPSRKRDGVWRTLFAGLPRQRAGASSCPALFLPFAKNQKCPQRATPTNTRRVAIQPGGGRTRRLDPRTDVICVAVQVSGSDPCPRTSITNSAPSVGEPLMSFQICLLPGRGQSGAALGAALLTTLLTSGVAQAADCPTVADPQGIVTAYPQQLDLPDYEKQIKHQLVLADNPLFAEQVAAGTLPPVADRVPQDALVSLPYQECGNYGGMLRGVSKALESGTSEILSWRQVNLVRISDDLTTLVPNVAKSWKWNDDFTSVTISLRKGHKWSDGAPFTADDVVFYIDDIIKNKELHDVVPSAWMVGGKPVEVTKIDTETFRFDFAAPYPGLLHFLATGGSYFAAYAPKHHYMSFLPAYNKKADEEAKAAGHEGWVQRFGLIWHKWKDAENITAHALIRPTLESHLIEFETNTQRRQYIANPYYFKVDTAGHQLPYIDRQHERFLDQELFILSILNGEVDVKTQTMSLNNYPVLKEGEVDGGYRVERPSGAYGPYIVFNQTIMDPGLRAVYSDVRFRKAMSMAINRNELNEVLWFDLGKPEQAVPIGVPFVTDADRNYLITHDPEGASALLDEMGMELGSDGVRTGPDGKPFTLLWEYTAQHNSSEFATLVADYWRRVGINVTVKEVTTQLMREKAAASSSDINMEWDVPYEPTMISQIDVYIPPYSDIGPLVGVPWRDWVGSNGASGEEPPAWVKQLFKLSEEWKTVLPGSERYLEIGAEMVKINLDNMVIIGTMGSLPRPLVVTNRLENVPKGWNVSHFNYGYDYPYRADQWFFQ